MIENVFAGSGVAAIWGVPALRQIAGVFLAVFLYKNCKARNYDKKWLWALFAMVSPVLSVAGFIIKTKISEDFGVDKDEQRSAKKYAIISVIIYVLALIIMVASVIVFAVSGVIGVANDSIELLPHYYDSNGVEHEDYRTIPIYDKDGNEYHLDEVSDGWNCDSYYDEAGNEYSLDHCYISQDGYFYYDENDELIDTKEAFYYYDKHWKDESGNLYAHIDNGVYWDEDGNLCIVYYTGRTRLAFE